MKISIITATYNSSKTITDTLKSVKRQTFSNIEHIVVDGNSTDNTLGLIKKHNHAGPIISEPDAGIYDAMNKGLQMATGDVIGILNSDDFFHDQYVVENIANAFQHYNCDAIYGDLVFVDKNNTSQIKRKWIAGGYNEKLFLKGWMPPHPTFYVKKEVYDKLGLFNTTLKSAADYELLLRFLYINQIKVQYLPGVIVHMREGGRSNCSIKNRLMAHFEDYKAWKLNKVQPNWYTVPLKPLRKVKQFIFTNLDTHKQSNLDIDFSFVKNIYNQPIEAQHTQSVQQRAIPVIS